MIEDNIAAGKFQVKTNVIIKAIHLAQFHTIANSAVLYICLLTKKSIHLVVIYSLAGLIGW